MTQVLVKQNESLDSALKRFKKQVMLTGILREARDHSAYQKPSDRKRKQKMAAIRKAQKNRLPNE